MALFLCPRALGPPHLAGTLRFCGTVQGFDLLPAPRRRLPPRRAPVRVFGPQCRLAKSRSSSSSGAGRARRNASPGLRVDRVSGRIPADRSHWRLHGLSGGQLRERANASMDERRRCWSPTVRSAAADCWLGWAPDPEPLFPKASRYSSSRTGEHEFRRVFRKAVHHHRLHNPFRESPPASSRMSSLSRRTMTASERRLLLRLTAHLHAAGEAVGVEQFHEGGEAASSGRCAGSRRGRGGARRASASLAHRASSASIRCRSVRRSRARRGAPRRGSAGCRPEAVAEPLPHRLPRRCRSLAGCARRGSGCASDHGFTP